MGEQKSRFALLLEQLSVRPADFGRAIGADKTLVSRWCSGSRKFMKGHQWVGKTADYLLAVDDRLKFPVIPEILSKYYEEKEIEKRLRDTFVHWLISVGYLPASDQDGVGEVIKSVFPPTLEMIGRPQEPDFSIDELPVFRNTVLEGMQGLLGGTVYFLKWLQENRVEDEFIYLCTGGVELFTRNQEYGHYIQEELEKTFAVGGSLTTILYTDYRATDVAFFSGGWLKDHLQGYINSYYFDDFQLLEDNRSCLVCRNRLALEMITRGNEIQTIFYFDQENIERIWNHCREYKKRSKKRFCYHFFQEPDGFLQNVQILPDGIHYQFSRMPYFGLTDKEGFGRDFLLSQEEADYVEREFSPFFYEIGFFDPDTPVRHMFCEEDIDEFLLQERHVCQVLSVILGRRVNMRSQALVYRLIRLRKLLEEHPNYEVCFLPREIFQQYKLQVCVWSARVLIGWLNDGGKNCYSGSSKETSSCNALVGFCATVWMKIPKHLRSRKAALQKIDLWLKKARRYGYKMEEM